MLRQGKVLRIYNSLFEVLEENSTARFICSKKKTIRNILVGDRVDFECVSQQGNIIKVLPRTNSILKPAIANIDLIIFIIAVKDPDYNFFQIDTVLEYFNFRKIDVVIIINKEDLAPAEVSNLLIYEKLGYKCIVETLKDLEEINMEHISQIIKGKSIVLAGNSGVGKSTLAQTMCKESIRIGSISDKNKRGKQTTKQVSLYYLEKYMAYLADTPGFSMIDNAAITKERILDFFKEFHEFSSNCKFSDCKHLNEPDCKVRGAVEKGQIAPSRYENYKKMLQVVKPQWAQK